jgi:hypothetical protein
LLLDSKYASASSHSLTCSGVSTGGGGSASMSKGSNAAPGTGPVEYCASACGRREPDLTRRTTALVFSRRPPPPRELVAFPVTAKAGSRRRLEREAETEGWSGSSP